jgi:hypothetical protein
MPPPRRRYRCRYCGYDFPAWLPVAKRPDGAMLLHHLAAIHRGRVGSYLRRMEAGECIDWVVVEAYEIIEGEDAGI